MNITCMYCKFHDVDYSYYGEDEDEFAVCLKDHNEIYEGGALITCPDFEERDK